MSKYSELIGSFERVGNFPIEADYIFESEEALNQWAIDNQVILHKGLLKIVASEKEQALYWCVEKQTNEELEFKKLIVFDSIEDLGQKLQSLKNELMQEVENRKIAEAAIVGDRVGTPTELNNIQKLASAITKMQENIKSTQEQNDKNHTDLKNDIQAIAGTENQDVISYINKLDYGTLTKISEKLKSFFDTTDPENPSIESLPAISDFLEGFTTSENLKEVLEKLINDIMGSPVPDAQFNTLRNIEYFVRKFKTDTENNASNLLNEVNSIETAIGINADGAYSPDKETHYLQDATSVMNALRTLDTYVHKALVGITIQPHNHDIVDLTIDSLENGYNIGAKLNLSAASNNQLKKNSDGLYYNFNAEYNNGTLTLKVNDSIISQISLGLSTIVNNAKYDPDTESIVIEFGLLTGQTQTVTIPVGTLIREWNIDNSVPSRVVELYREEAIGGGSDKLSADVRLDTKKTNILKKEGNSLLVDGVATNIIYDGEVTVYSKLTELAKSNATLGERITSEANRATAKENDLNTAIQTETNRATEKETEIQTETQAKLTAFETKAHSETDRVNAELLKKADKAETQKQLDAKANVVSPQLQGVPTVEVSPDSTDSSQRIPSTAWVVARIKDLEDKVQALLDKKADLVNGKIPLAQMPDELSLTWIEAQ